MEYRNYNVYAEVQRYDFYSLDTDGTVDQYDHDGAGFDVTGYEFTNDDTGDSFFETMSRCTREELESFIDSRILQLKEGKA